MIMEICSKKYVAPMFPLLYTDVKDNTGSNAVEKGIHCPVTSKWEGWM